MKDIDYCNALEPAGIPAGLAMKWRFRFLSLLRPLKKVSAEMAARAAHAAAREIGLYNQ